MTEVRELFLRLGTLAIRPRLDARRAVCVSFSPRTKRFRVVDDPGELKPSGPCLPLAGLRCLVRLRGFRGAVVCRWTDSIRRRRGLRSR